MKIVKAKKSDFPEIFILFKELWPNEKFSRKNTLKVWEGILKKKDSLQLVAREHNKIVGYSAIDCRLDIESKGKIGYLSELIIIKNNQGKGHGKLLLKETMKLSKQIGCKEIHFPSTAKRKKAWKLYKSLGFKNTALFFWKEL